MVEYLRSPSLVASQIKVRVVGQVDHGFLGGGGLELDVETVVVLDLVGDAGDEIPGVALLAILG